MYVKENCFHKPTIKECMYLAETKKISLDSAWVGNNLADPYIMFWWHKHNKWGNIIPKFDTKRFGERQFLRLIVIIQEIMVM